MSARNRKKTHLTLDRVAAGVAVISFAALGDARALVLLVPLFLVGHFVARHKLSRAVELAAYALLAGLVVVLARYGGDPRGGTPTAVALVAAAFVLLRAAIAPSFAAKGADLALVILAATAIGAPPQRFLPFGPVATLLVAIAATGALPARFDARAPWRNARALLPSAVFLTLAVIIGLGAGRIMPRITYRYAARLSHAFWDRPRSGFDDDLFLADGDGSAPKILESDRVVLKVNGANVDHLRGKVYDFFDGHRWHGIGTFGDAVAPVSAADSRKSVAIEAVVPSHVYYAPLDRSVRGTRPRDGGVAKGPLRAAWELDPSGPTTAPPTARDLRTDRSFPEELRALAQEWTRDRTNDNDRLIALEDHLLRDYRYTLERAPFTGSALRDFLWGHRAGHCELFATAFALLARSLGIHARVIGGYRVLEPGPLGDTYVVRDRHAHAWVEAYHGDAWHTWDPTPATAFAHKASAWERVLEVLSDPAAVAILGVVVVTIAVALAVRSWLVRRREKATLPPRALHPELRRLEDALAEEGVVRDPAEGLLTFATRLERDADTTGADAVRACAFLVYGEEGSLATLTALVDARLAKGPRGENKGEPPHASR